MGSSDRLEVSALEANGRGCAHALWLRRRCQRQQAVARAPGGGWREAARAAIAGCHESAG
ncbi:hypothetical protein chiPu_0024530, partial [Chiloscyllium punctatum]|nr:hypothetical protein [Chiloscyllium punctatum]